jgi:hypothetical protein
MQQVRESIANLSEPAVVDKTWRDWWQKKCSQEEELFIAAEKGDIATLQRLVSPSQVLLDHGLSQAYMDYHVHAKGLDDWTALHHASEAGHVGAIEVLLAARADPADRTATGLIPLHLAARRGHVECVVSLLDASADSTAGTAEGTTSLHLAAERMHRSVCQELCRRRPQDRYLRDALDRVPADCAGDAETYKLLGGSGQLSDGYGRVVFGGMLLRNSRADYVSAFLRQLRKDGRGSKVTVSRTASRADVLEGSPRPAPAPRNTPRTPRVTLRERTSLANPGPDGFDAEAMLGKGSFGEVYRVRRRSDGALFAMKLLQKAKILGKNMTRYALTERNVLSYIDHPFIIKLHYAFQTSQHLVLVMDLAEGGSLHGLIVQSQTLPEDLTTHYLAEVFLALEHLHARSILYRDLKPDNIILKDRHCLLTDFGLSKESNNASAHSFCGSTAYLSPEMLSRKGHGHSVDVWGLGVLAYEMRTGVPPFYSHDRAALYRNIQSSQLRIPASLSPALASFIRATMERDINLRLGGKNTSDVRAHRLFKEVDWDALLSLEVDVPAWPPALVTSRRTQPRTLAQPLNLRRSGRQLDGWNYVAPRRA